MNKHHLEFLASPDWARWLESETLPWVLGVADLGDDVLEIGPGPGITTAIIRQRAPRMTLLEIDPWSVRQLREKFADGVEVVEGDATRMPFDDGRFSAAICLTMFHHVPSAELQDVLVAEAHRVLRPGGLFLGSDSTASWRFTLYHLGDTCVPVDPDRFGDRLQRAGFVDPKISKAGGSFRFRASKP